MNMNSNALYKLKRAVNSIGEAVKMAIIPSIILGAIMATMLNSTMPQHEQDRFFGQANTIIETLKNDNMDKPDVLQKIAKVEVEIASLKDGEVSYEEIFSPFNEKGLKHIVNNIVKDTGNVYSMSNTNHITKIQKL